MKPYLVFLSSPNDVITERDRAELVMKRLNAERVDHPQFEIIRREHEFYRAEADFQAQIPKPADCQLVVCLFWKRLGTELPPQYARPDGTLPTGTEYEFENALQAAAARPEKLPDVLVYRKTAEVMFAADNLELERAQYDRFMAFWQRWFRNEKGHFLAGFQTFQQPDDFEVQLDRNLRAWLRDRETDVTWTGGSPFRGLEPFNVEHAAIFFGRRREVERSRARLIAAAMGGRPFLLISGASGSGKSSLARAGLIPRLRQVGGLSTLGAALRYAILTPGEISGHWATGLAKALFEKSALGEELAHGDFCAPEALAKQLVHADASAALPIARSLARAGEAIAQTEQRENAPTIVLVILIDQLEELFAWPKADAEHFLRLLQVLCAAQGAPVWLLATMRSDFQHRLHEFPALEELAGRTEIKGPEEAERTLELALPSAADLREMIIKPAQAAGLIYEMSQDGRRDLAELIEGQARPEAMPAIQYLLSELYRRKRVNVLTLESFDELKGVGGVMAQRGEEIYYGIDASDRAAFPRIVRALVAQVRGDVPATVRRISEKTFANDRAAGRLLDKLKDARLVISDRGEIRFAHDSILTGWKRLEEQIREEQRLFEARDRLEQLCRRWVEGDASGMRPGKLLLQGFPLAEGRELAAKWGTDSLKDRQPELPAFIAASDARDRRVRRLTQAIGWTVAAVFAVLAWKWNENWIAAERARRESQAALWVANSRTDLRDRRIASAIDNARKAFDELPNETTRSALASALYELSPNLAATFEVRTDYVDALTWSDSATIDIVSGRNGGELQALSTLQRKGLGPVAGWALPRLTRTQDGNSATVRLMRFLGEDRIAAVLNDGTLAVMDRGAAAPYLLRPSVPTTLSTTENAAAIGRSGALIATASIDGPVAVIECPKQTTASTMALDCRRRELAGVRGRVVAISPDEMQLAVGDEAGDVTVLDRSGQRIGAPMKVGGLLLALGWGGQQSWIAAGNMDGSVAVFDTAGPEHHMIEATSLQGKPITALAWSPKSAELAFACDGEVICLWQPGPVGGDTAAEAPVHRYEGHTGAVTRLSWSPTGEHLASAASDGSVRVWSRAQNPGAALAFFAEASVRLSSVATSPDGHWLAAGAKDGSVRIWDVDTMALRRIEKITTDGEIVTLSWSRSGLVAAASDDGSVAVISPEPAQAARMLEIDTDFNTRLAWAENDNTLAVPSHLDKSVALIDLSEPSLKLTRRLDPIDGGAMPWGLIADPSGKLLIVTYRDPAGAIRVWDLATLKPLGDMTYNLPQPRDPVAAGSLSIGNGGKLLAISGGDKFLRLFDIKQRTSWRALETADANEPQAVAFSPDGAMLAELGTDGRLYVWSVRGETTERIAVFNAVPKRASVFDGDRRQGSARWLAFIGNDAIAVAAETPAIEVMGLAPAKWQARIEAVAPVSAFTVK